MDEGEVFVGELGGVLLDEMGDELDGVGEELHNIVVVLIQQQFL